MKMTPYVPPEGDNARAASHAPRPKIDQSEIDAAIKRGRNPQLPGDRRPVIVLSPDLDDDLRKCEQALMASTLVEVYQRGGFIVTRGTDKRKTFDGETVTYDDIAHHDSDSFSIVLAKAMRFMSYSRRERDHVQCHLPGGYSAKLLANKEKNYPVLLLISAPTVRHDGSILDKPGFDERTGLYFNPKGVDFGAIKENPTKGDAVEALDVLLKPVSEFPFVDGASRSVFLAHLLTSLCRQSLDAAPMAAYTAPTMRTGKGKLVNIVSVVSHGHKAPVVGASSNPEEIDKQLSALVRSGVAIIAIDNQDPDIPLSSCLLSQMLTEADVRVRAFGDNKNMPKYPSTSTISCTGNNLVIAKDLVERTILCSLDAKTESPGTRTFNLGVDPVEWASRNRVKMVQAALTILRAYQAAGRAPQSFHPMGGFETWDARVRAPIVWIGLDDPCGTMDKVRDSDPGSGTLATIMELWWRKFHESAQTAGAAVKAAKRDAEKVGGEGDDDGSNSEFYDALWGVAEKGTKNLAMALGRRLKSKDLVVLNGKRFVSEITHKQSAFRIETVNHQ